jgi:hypothetical protein
MKSPAFALESEVDPEVALQMSLELEMIRGFPPPQRVAAKFLVARHFMAFVTAARKEKGGNLASPNLKDATATSGAPKMETATSAVETRKRDDDMQGAAKGGDAGGRQLAAKGRGDQPRQGGRFAGKAAGKPTTSVRVGRGWCGPSTGAGRPATANTLRPGGQTRWSGGSSCGGFALAAPGKCRRHYLTGTGRLWMAWKRLLLPRCGGHVVHRGWRS